MKATFISIGSPSKSECLTKLYVFYIWATNVLKKSRQQGILTHCLVAPMIYDFDLHTKKTHINIYIYIV